MPDSPTTANRNKILVVTMELRGAVDINRQPEGNYYFVLINRTNNIGDPGPAPVTGLPWGNGFAAASRPDAQGFVGFVRIDRQQPNQFGVYSCRVGDTLVNPVQNNFTPLGPPDRFEPLRNGDTRLTFQLDLGRLPNADQRYLQVNLLATDTIPRGAEDTPKRWDALGDGRSASLTNFVVIDTLQNQTVTNAQQVGGAQEVEGDVRDRLGPIEDVPSLDIVNWSLQLRDP